MRIQTLTLKNFRNYEDETFTFDGGLNVLYGRNAQGKTNCAEAVFYLCTGTSPRARKDRQMIRAGQESAHIAALADTRFGSVRIEADIFESRREVRINGSKIARNADLLGNIDGVFFSPSELRIVQDGPEERRRFLNVSLSQMSRSYYTALVRYNKILEQRNALLKSRDLSLVFETLPVWDAQLCRYAAEIVRRRGEYIAMLSPLAAERHARLTDGAEQLSISSERKYAGEEGEIEQALLRERVFRKLRARRPPRLHRLRPPPRRFEDRHRRQRGARVRLAGADAHRRPRHQAGGGGNFPPPIWAAAGG